MPVIRINAEGATPVLHRGTGSWAEALRRSDPGTGPVVVMIHGYKYRPGDPRHCPHRHILALQPDDHPYRSPSWPRQLGFGAGAAEEGLAIAFGWSARGPLWAARRRAVEAGRALAQVLRTVEARHPGRPVHMMAHSLGLELCMEALHHLPAGAVQRIIAMTGACYGSRVQAALGSEAGQTAELINVTSRENDLFEALFEWVIAPPARGDRGIGLSVAARNAVTVQIDHPAVLDALERLGQPLAAPERRVCHWSAYTRPGILRFYTALLRRPEAYPLSLLQQVLPPESAARWSRLTALPDRPSGISLARGWRGA